MAGVQAAAAEQRITPRCLRAVPRDASTARVPGGAGWDLIRARRAMAAPLRSPPSREATQKVWGHFSAFLIFAPLLELIYPCGSRSSMREGHVLPL